MVLLGGWQPALPDDCALVTALGASPEELRALGERLTNIPEAQFSHLPAYRRERETLRFRDPPSAFFSLASVLDEAAVARFARGLTGAAARALSLSRPLQQGLCCALACLGNGEGRVALARSPAALATALVADLLSAPPRWAWFGANLPLLAEAAPLAFLDRFEAALQGAEAPAWTRDAAVRTGLCHSLSTLAWAVDLLPRAAAALAALADSTEGQPAQSGDLALSSLAALFRPVAPQTAADISERLRVLRIIAAQHPSCAWSLLQALLPRPGFGQVLHESRRPTVLKLALPRRWPRAYQGESYGQVRAFLALAFSLAAQYDARWARIVGSLQALPPSLQGEVLQRLQEVARALTPTSQATHAALRKAQPVLDLPADDGGSPELRPAVDRLLRQLEPADAAARDGWLFLPSEWRHTAAGFAADAADMERRQRQALAALAQQADRWERLERLVQHLAQSSEYGVACSSLGQRLAETPWAEELAESLSRTPVAGPLKELVPWFLAWHLAARYWADTEAMVRGLVSNGRGEDAATLLVRLSTGEREERVWDLVDAVGEPLRTAFWRGVPPYWGNERGAALQERFVRQLAAQQRWRDAATAASRSPALSFALRAEILTQIADELHREEQRRRASWQALHDQGRTAEVVEMMFDTTSWTDAIGHTVAQVLETLHPRDEAETAAAGRLEAALLPALTGPSQRLRFLPQQLAAHPEWFARAAAQRPGPAHTALADVDEPPAIDLRALAQVWSGFPGDSLPRDQQAPFLERWCRSVLRHHPRPDDEEHLLCALAPFLSRGRGADGIWPGDAARALLQEHPALGRYLRQGGDGAWTRVSRERGEGGGRERARAAARRQDAANLPPHFSLARALLLRLAEEDELLAADEDAAAKAERWSEPMGSSRAWSDPLFPLRDVRIENVRGVRDLVVPLDPRLTLIFGKNASGKSTVLDAIAMGLSAIADRLPRTDGQRAEDRPELHYRDLRRTWERGEEVPAAFARITLSAQLRDERDEPLTWSVATRYAADAAQVADRESPQLGGYLEWLNEGLRRNQEAVLLPVFAHYGVERAVSAQAKEDASGNQRGSRRREAGLDGALAGAARFDRAVAAFFYLENIEARLPGLPVAPGEAQRRPELPALREVRQAIEKAVRTPNGWRCERPRIDVSASKFLIDLVDEGGRRQELQLAQLSDGFRTHLALVMDLALRMVECNPLREGGPQEGRGIRSHAVVLIDEVDLHLHPQWQREVLAGLLQAFPHCQFVVTTHSPQVLAGVRDGLVYKLAEAEDGSPLLESVRAYGKDSNGTLTEDMDTNERPAEIKHRIREINGLLDEDRYSEAEAAVDRLQEELGHDDAALVGLRTDLALLRADDDEER